MANEKYLMRRLIDGISGWLTYQQAAGAKTLYCEHFLYPPIHEIASGRKWTVRAQERVKRQTGARGSPRTVDFIFFRTDTKDYKPGLIFLEVKYLRGSNPTIQLREIGNDIKKLSGIGASDVESATTISKCGTAKKFILVAAQDFRFKKFARTASIKNPEVVQMLASSLRTNLPRSVYRSTVESKLKEEFHWHALAFGERAWSN